MAGTRRNICRLAIVLLLAADAVLACGQTMRRPPLRAGSTSVVLIARVESLSVVANAEAAVRPAIAGGPVAPHPVSITTSWAVPANYTSFRLSEFFGQFGAIPVAPEGGGLGPVRTPARLAVDGPGELVVDSGATNEPRTRTDELDSGVNPGGAGKPGADEERGLLNILIQAL